MESMIDLQSHNQSLHYGRSTVASPIRFQSWLVYGEEELGWKNCRIFHRAMRVQNFTQMAEWLISEIENSAQSWKI